jgi:hypothetical protein
LLHPFIKEYCRAVGSRQRELDEAVKALKTHIQIHKGALRVGCVHGRLVVLGLVSCGWICPRPHTTEWKISPQMVELLAKELRIKSSNLWEYLDAHLELGLLLTATSSSTTTTTSFKDARDSPASASASGAGGLHDAIDSGRSSDGAAGGGGGCLRLDFSFSAATTAADVGVGGAITPLGRTAASAASAASAVTASESEEGEEPGGAVGVEEDSLQATLLRQYDELDRLRTEVIPPMEELVEELRRQVRERDERLAEAHGEINALRRRLQVASASSGSAGGGGDDA